MAEISGDDETLDEVVAHLQSLFQLSRKGPPRWVQYDLTFGQLRLLFVLAQSGPVSVGQLADMLGVSDATASEIVDRIARRGLAIRSHRSDDRRVVECRLSDAGARLLAEVAGARREGLRAALSVLTPAERKQLDGLILAMVHRRSAGPSTPTSSEGASQMVSETARVTPERDRGGTE
jgi:DNA-binding MarR family transcriptional regulator